MLLIISQRECKEKTSIKRKGERNEERYHSGRQRIFKEGGGG